MLCDLLCAREGGIVKGVPSLGVLRGFRFSFFVFDGFGPFTFTTVRRCGVRGVWARGWGISTADRRGWQEMGEMGEMGTVCEWCGGKRERDGEEGSVMINACDCH